MVATKGIGLGGADSGLKRFDEMEAIREQVAQAARVLSRLGYLDAIGHVSARVGADAYAVTPSFNSTASPLPLLATEEVIVVDGRGRSLAGDLEPTPELPLHLEVYRARSDVESVVVASPQTAVAFAIADRPLLPVTHGEAWIAHEGASIVDLESFVSTGVPARWVAETLGDRSVCHVRGVAAVFAAPNVTAAVRLCHAYEYLARMNLLTAPLTDRPRGVTPDETARIQSEKFAESTRGAVDHGAYFASFDPAPTKRSRDRATDVRSNIARACRALATRGTLVALYEHVSQRVPGEERFAMCPARNFASMEPTDIAVLGLDEDPPWLDGPHPPAPYRRFHRDVFVARPDVQAIVHTHEMFGRALGMAGINLQPVFRNGVALAGPIPTVERPSLVFGDDDRERALQTLGLDAAVHVTGHGTDYVAGSLEEATVMAIHREEASTVFHMALRVGTPRPLSPAMVREIRRTGPRPERWWAHYTALI